MVCSKGAVPVALSWDCRAITNLATWQLGVTLWKSLVSVCRSSSACDVENPGTRGSKDAIADRIYSRADHWTKAEPQHHQ
jgi:hypothetical protein